MILVINPFILINIRKITKRKFLIKNWFLTKTREIYMIKKFKVSAKHLSKNKEKI